eukprot:TRINITY_DN9062_c0_g1_i1.p3 TRINITY_DN9062_c0_g1~~TRINITY_DN9062_c0_g1_i1.p3  ORF type:complete len:103 (-),score=0.30 TRINITY_DN9062_c0_g1_i1:230-538(-)
MEQYNLQLFMVKQFVGKILFVTRYYGMFSIFCRQYLLVSQQFLKSMQKRIFGDWQLLFQCTGLYLRQFLVEEMCVYICQSFLQEISISQLIIFEIYVEKNFW